MKNGICPKCKSDKVIEDEIKINPPSAALMMKGLLTVDNVKGFNPKSMQAYICCECGFTELYVVNPTSLWRKHDGNH